MNVCPHCGRPVADGAERCSQCGQALPQVCPACGQPAPAGFKFCGHCGARLPVPPQPPPAAERPVAAPASQRPVADAPAEPIGERREVTVLFADVSNFTAVARTLDSEEVFLLVNEAMRLLADVIARYDGVIDKYTGDGLMALFGAPHAHENDPERAVRAALDMQDALRPMRERVLRQHGIDFLMRIGVNTGDAVAGQIGGGPHAEYTVIGDTVNLAARLQSAAEPGSILVSQTTCRRCPAFFEFKALPPLQLKGLEQPALAFQPLAVHEHAADGRAATGGMTPLVGRSDALGRLREAVDRLRHGRGSPVVFISGEAGVGKSRLAAELRNTLAGEDVRIYQAACLAYTPSAPYWLVADALRDLLAAPASAPADVQRSLLHEYLTQTGVALEQHFPYLCDVLKLGQADADAEARLAGLDAAMLQRQTHAALFHVFLAQAQQGPTIVILEDLQWIDAASREFLERLVQATAGAPLMLVLIARDFGPETGLRSLAAAAEKQPDRLVGIELAGLSEAEVQLLVARLLNRPAEDAEGVCQRIAARAAGNPLYAEEVVRMLIDQGGLVSGPAGDDWRPTPLADALLHEVPDTIRGLILARVDCLSNELRATLQRAALLGTTFPTALLIMLDEGRSEALIVRLGELEARRFLAARSFDTVESYVFRHVLVQETVYRTLLRRQRQRLHAQAAATIEQSRFWPADECTELLAYHYAESSTPAKALPHLIAAGDNAARRGANDNAISYYRRALGLTEDGPDSARERAHIQAGLGRALKLTGEYTAAAQVLAQAESALQSACAPPADLLEVWRELADVRQREGDFDAAVLCLERGLAMAEQAGDVRTGGRSLRDRLAWVRFRQGNLGEALRLAQKTLAECDLAQPDEPLLLASLHNTLGGVYWQMGELDQATHHVERSLELYKSWGYVWGMAIGHTNLGVLDVVRGQWPRALANLETAYALRRDNGYVAEQALTLNNLGLLRMQMGDLARAHADWEACLTLSQRLGDDFGVVLAQIGLAHLAVLAARWDDAATHLEAAQALLASAGADEAAQVRWLAALVQTELRQHPLGQGAPSASSELALNAVKGQALAAGLESAALALQTARAAGLAEAETDSLRVLGDLQGRAGAFAEAEAHLRQAAVLAEGRRDLYRQGLALLALGRLYLVRMRDDAAACAGWQDRAEQALSAAERNFARLGAGHQLRLTAAALAEIAPASFRIANPPCPATASPAHR